MVQESISLISVVCLLAWMFFFTVSSLPLFVLKHDEPTDARFIHGFFDVQYVGLMSIAAVGTLSSAVSNRRLMTVAMACIAFIGFAAHHGIVSRMNELRGSMTATDVVAIRKFRRLHLMGIALNICLMLGYGFAIFLAAAELDAR